jgi:hypothetical protein
MGGLVMNQEGQPKKRKGRSPGYPGIGLQAAIERAKVIYKEEGRTAAHVDAILHDWGYKPKSGAGLVVLAALKKFGLLVDEGTGPDRKARLSDEALEIIFDEQEESPARDELIKKAALRPAIHAELWKEYRGRLPSDAELRLRLRKQGFTDTAVQEFIGQFRSTISFAKLDSSASLPDEPESGGLEAEIKLTSESAIALKDPKAGDKSTAIQTLRAPLGRGKAVLVQMPERMTPKEWERFEANLAAWKLGTVEEDDGQEAES